MRDSFFILSNGRTGSTWLSSLLNDCDDLLTRGELKWRPIGFKPSPHHFIVDHTTSSLPALLEEKIGPDPKFTTHEIRACGSKMVFDPQCLLEPEIYGHIFRAIPAEAPLIHLRRSYLEVFLSFNARGAIHRLSERAQKNEGQSLDWTMRDQIAGQNADHRPPQLVLIQWGRLRLFLLDRLLRKSQVQVMSLSHFMEEILTYFIHDVYLASFMKERKATRFVDYAEISSRFSELASFVGSQLQPQQTNALLQTPFVEKLPNLPPELAWPSQMASYFCEVLDDEIRAFTLSADRAEDVARWDARTRSFTIRSQRLADFMEMSEAAWKGRKSAFRLQRPDTVVIRPRKPIRAAVEATA